MKSTLIFSLLLTLFSFTQVSAGHRPTKRSIGSIASDVKAAAKMKLVSVKHKAKQHPLVKVKTVNNANFTSTSPTQHNSTKSRVNNSTITSSGGCFPGLLGSKSPAVPNTMATASQLESWWCNQVCFLYLLPD